MLPTAWRRQTRAAVLKKSGPFDNSVYLVLASPVARLVKNLPANAGDIRATVSILRLGRSPGGGHGNQLQYFCLENPMDRGAWWAIVHELTKELDMTEQLSMHAHAHFDFSSQKLRNDLWLLPLSHSAFIEWNINNYGKLCRRGPTWPSGSYLEMMKVGQQEYSHIIWVN